MIDGPPKIVSLAVDLHEHLVKMPTPTAGFHTLYPALSDLSGEHWTEPVPPESHSLMTDIDAALVQQVLDVAKGQRKTDVHHNRKADDLLACLEIIERAAFRHPETLLSTLPRRKTGSLDTTA